MSEHDVKLAVQQAKAQWAQREELKQLRNMVATLEIQLQTALNTIATLRDAQSQSIKTIPATLYPRTRMD